MSSKRFFLQADVRSESEKCLTDSYGNRVTIKYLSDVVTRVPVVQLIFFPDASISNFIVKQ